MITYSCALLTAGQINMKISGVNLGFVQVLVSNNRDELISVQYRLKQMSINRITPQ